MKNSSHNINTTNKYNLNNDNKNDYNSIVNYLNDKEEMSEEEFIVDKVSIVYNGHKLKKKFTTKN